ncbi:MAG: AMP-binding protein, partial [Ginsengibacter sp.]
MISIPQRLLGEALLLSAKNNPSKIAVIAKEQEYSYEQLRNHSENFARYLISTGIKKDDRIAIYMDNSWQSIISIYGITLSGGVFLVINPQTKADKLKYILNDCEAKILISTSALKNELSRALEETNDLQEVIITGENSVIKKFPHYKITNFENCLQDDIQKVVFPNIIPNDLAALIYTSGSTGFPKGVMMTHQSMVFTSWSLVEYLRLSEKDRIMLILPLAFDYGLYQLLMS